MLKKIRNSQGGFTLAEALISILLLAIVLAGGTGFYFNSTDVMTMAMHKKIAMEMANQAMEQIKDGGYTGASVNPATITWAPSSNPFNVIEWSNGSFDFKVQEQRRVTDIGSPANKQVEVRVCWPVTDPSVNVCESPTSQKINLATYIAP